jgi:hypothetical protein
MNFSGRTTDRRSAAPSDFFGSILEKIKSRIRQPALFRKPVRRATKSGTGVLREHAQPRIEYPEGRSGYRVRITSYKLSLARKKRLPENPLNSCSIFRFVYTRSTG